MWRDEETIDCFLTTHQLLLLTSNGTTYEYDKKVAMNLTSDLGVYCEKDLNLVANPWRIPRAAYLVYKV
jgi:hypothetical protein